MSTHTFPEGFLWGAATASYQVEGGIENCDWAKAAQEERVPVCGRACDHYYRYAEDFDLAKGLGHNAHRFSIEWARIEPEEGKFDEREIEHYRDVLRSLRARGLVPYVTLWHFTLPVWFTNRGGWLCTDAPDVFARYCTFVVRELGDLADNYATINEPIVYASNGWIRGIWPPFQKFAPVDLATIVTTVERERAASRIRWTPYTYLKVRRSLARAHNSAYAAIKKERPRADVSIVKNVIVYDSDGSLLNRLKAWLMNRHWTYSFMDRVGKQTDSIGLNYYFYKKFGDTATYDKTDMHWDIVPHEIATGLRMLARYGKPLYVAEAGLADQHDTKRAAYIKNTVQAVEEVVRDGIDIRAFFYWSLLDNYEWAAGFGQRFGLVEVDYDTLARTVRPSAYAYRDTIEHGVRAEKGA